MGPQLSDWRSVHVAQNTVAQLLWRILFLGVITYVVRYEV